jgi:hypothetical protein
LVAVLSTFPDEEWGKVFRRPFESLLEQGQDWATPALDLLSRSEDTWTSSVVLQLLSRLAEFGEKTRSLEDSHVFETFLRSPRFATPAKVEHWPSNLRTAERAEV